MMFGSPEVNPPPPFRSFSSSGQIPSTKSCYFGENYCVGAPCDFPPTHAHSEGDCVSDNVSVVTLRAPDSSVFMTNGTHVTSQSESEFSLQDVKMSFDAKRNVPEPTSKPPPSPAAFCTVADTPTGHANIAHPGLDMLSDVSLFVEAYMTSPTGRIRTEAKPFQKTFSRYSDIPEVPNVEVEALDRHASLDMPAPPSATYIGVMKHEADSTGNFRRRDPRTSETDTAYSSSASIGHSSQDSEGSENASAANTIAALESLRNGPQLFKNWTQSTRSS
nr:hypothetical protein BaRGS_030056 [Batillaria attramentaria]